MSHEANVVSHKETLSPHSGVIIVVQALPTADSIGNEYIGGVGASTIATKLSEIFPQAHLIKTGEIMRSLVANEAGRILTETEFEERRRQLEDDPHLDKKLDKEVIAKVQQTMSQPNCVVILESKLAGLLLKQSTQLFFPDKMPQIFIIGVDADNEVATTRYLYRQAVKGIDRLFGNPTTDTTKDLKNWAIRQFNPTHPSARKRALNQRNSRMTTDRNTYNNAYGFDFSRQQVLNQCDLILNNTSSSDEDTKVAWIVEQLILLTRGALANEINQTTDLVIPPEKPKVTDFQALDSTLQADKLWNEIIGLMLDTQYEMGPGQHFNEVNFFTRDHTQYLIDYIDDPNDKVAAVMLSQPRRLNQIPIVHIDRISTRKDCRSQGLRTQLIQHLQKDQEKRVLTMLTWRIDTLLYPTKDEELVFEVELFNLAEKIALGRSVSPTQDQLKELSRRVKVHHINTALGFLLVTNSNPSNYHQINYLYQPYHSNHQLSDMGYRVDNQGLVKIEKISQYLSSLNANPTI